MQANLIRGKIVARFGTVAEFSKAIGYSPVKTSKILNQRQGLSAEDIKVFSDALGIKEPSEVVALFL